MKANLGLQALLGLLAGPSNVSAFPGMFQRGHPAGAAADTRAIELVSSNPGQSGVTGKDLIGPHAIAHGEALAYRQSQSGETTGMAAFLNQIGLSRAGKRENVDNKTRQENEEIEESTESRAASAIARGVQSEDRQQENPQPSQGKADNRTISGMHAQSLNKIHLKQLEALKHGHLQADEQLGLQQEAERMELRAKQQAAVDRVMASQGKQKLDDYTLAEDNVLRMLLAPLDVELQRQFTALLAKQKEAKSELLKSQKEKLESLQAQQATRSKEMGLKVSDELPGWADAYRRELEEKAKSKAKQVEEPPNPFCSGYCGRRRR